MIESINRKSLVMHSIVNQHNLNQMDELMCTQMHTCSRNYHLCFQYQPLTTQNKNYWINGQGWLLQLMDGVNLLLWSKVIYKRYGKPIQKYRYRLYKSKKRFISQIEKLKILLLRIFKF